MDLALDPPRVLVRIGDVAQLPASVAAPGSEYIRVFDLVHEAVLSWSPNTAAALRAPVPGLCGSPSECSTEDAVNAVTFALLEHPSELFAGAVLDPDVVDAVVRVAAHAPTAPTSTELWHRCLHRSLEVHHAVHRLGVRRLDVDLAAGQVLLRP